MKRIILSFLVGLISTSIYAAGLVNGTISGTSFPSVYSPLAGSFINKANINDLPTQQRVNNIFNEALLSGYGYNLVAGALFNPSFNPTNHVQITGNSWIYTNEQYSPFGALLSRTGIQRILVPTPNLVSNFTLCICWRDNSGPELDQGALAATGSYFFGCPWAFIDTNFNSALFEESDPQQGNQADEVNWSAGVYTKPTPVRNASTNGFNYPSSWGQDASSTFHGDVKILCISRYVGGNYRAWMNTVPCSEFSGTAFNTCTNLWFGCANYLTNTLNCINFGNLPAINVFGVAVGNTQYDPLETVSSVFLFNTVPQEDYDVNYFNLVNVAYRMSLRAQNSHELHLVLGDSQLAPPGGGGSLSANMHYNNPVAIFEGTPNNQTSLYFNLALGGSDLGTQTNITIHQNSPRVAYPSTPWLMRPADWITTGRVITDSGHNMVGNLGLGSGVFQPWVQAYLTWNQCFAPFATNGMPVSFLTAWNTFPIQAQYNTNYIFFADTMRTNPYVSHYVDMGGLFATNWFTSINPSNSLDQTHQSIYTNFAGNTFIARLIGGDNNVKDGVNGTVTLAAVPGYTNYTLQTYMIFVSSGTAIATFDKFKNQTSPAGISPTSFILRPFEAFTGTTVTFYGSQVQ